MKTQFAILVAAFGMANLTAMASEQAPSGNQIITFQELRAACADPVRYHNQVAPSNIQVSCTEMKTKWVADPQSSVTLPTKRVVVTSVASNKYTVSPTTAELASDPQTATCDQYKQVIETVDAVQSTSCERILSFEGAPEEFCAASIDALRVGNPDAIKVQETGKKAGFCNPKMLD